MRGSTCRKEKENEREIASSCFNAGTSQLDILKWISGVTAAYDQSKIKVSYSNGRLCVKLSVKF